MELALVSRVLGVVGEAGIFALGWVLFFWAMWLLRIERRRYQDLVVHVIQYFTKVNMIQGTEDDTDAIRTLFGKSVTRRNDGRSRSNSHPANDERTGTE